MTDIDITQEDYKLTPQIKEIKAMTDYFSSVGEKSDNVRFNYNKQPMILNTQIQREMSKVEKEIFKNWNLDGGIYIEEDISGVIATNLTDLLYFAKDISELNNIKVLENCKNKLIEYFNEKIEQYSQKYNIEKNTEQSIKNNIPKMIETHLYKVTNKLLTYDTEKNLKKMCIEQEKAYKNKDFDTMNKVSKSILKYVSKPTTFYRNKELYQRLENDVCRNKMVQNKLKKGENGTLSSIEENMLLKFSKVYT